MDNNYISAPSQFEHMDGNSIDFKKTFDLNGTSNDDMLRLYLRKAGLSDEIECLSPEQRRAFIYDIIKSNKMPGYWMPSTMKTTSFALQSPATRPPPPPPARQNTNSVMVELRNEPVTPTLHYATMSTSSSSGSLTSMGRNSPLMPQKYAQPKNVPASPTTVVKNKNGVKYEISGPINFTHISGDMTRDMTKNAFDLTLTMNDNVLKKYLIERGIKDEEIAGMRKQDLIRKIVQSRYTWMPPGHNQISRNEHQYVGRTSGDETSAASPSIATFSSSSSSSQPTTPLTAFQSVEKSGQLSNFALVTSRFADSSLFPSPDSLYSNVTDPDPDVSLRTRLPAQTMRPAPPPRKPKNDREYDEVPPPPSSITASTNERNNYFTKFEPEIYNEAGTQNETNEISNNVEHLYAVPMKKSAAPKNPYLQSFIATPEQSQAYKPADKTNREMFTEAASAPPPPPPPLPPLMPNLNSNADAPLPSQATTANKGTSIPPPPQMLQTKTSTASSSSPNEDGTGDPKEDFLASIRQGVTLKKVTKKGATIGAFKPRPVRKIPVTEFQQAPAHLVSKNASGVPPPPPPPPPLPKSSNNNGVLPAPLPKTSLNEHFPPSTMSKTSINQGEPTPPISKTSLNNGVPPSPSNGGPPPPPPPPPPLKEQTNTAAAVTSVPNTGYSGDPRDAFLESIRNGVALKKVDKKSATISGIKPRAERKPPVTDFLSELKMGITLRRVKNPTDNIFADGPDESEA